VNSSSDEKTLLFELKEEKDTTCDNIKRVIQFNNLGFTALHHTCRKFTRHNTTYNPKNLNS
jgi:hypothetical protein